MEAKKSHDLLSVSWRPRKTSGGVPAKPKGLRTRGAKGVSPSLSPKAWEPGALMSEGRRWMSQLKQRENSPFLNLFVLFRPSKDWMMPILFGEGNLSLLNLWIQMLVSSETSSETPRNNVLPAIWTSFSPIKLTSKINHHNIYPLFSSFTPFSSMFFIIRLELLFTQSSGSHYVSPPSQLSYHHTLII